MAEFTFNIAKGRIVEFYNRAENNDPTNSALILVPLSATGLESQGQDFDDLAAVLGDANFTEQTTTWSRKPLESAELAALPAPDDTNNRYGVQVPVVTWVAPAAPNDTVGLLVCYDPDTTGGTDSGIIPLTHHDFVVAADGNNVVLQISDFIRAS